MNNKTKAKAIMEYFGVYGYGNFDISTEEFAKLLDMDAKKDIREYYEQLEKQRMG